MEKYYNVKTIYVQYECPKCKKGFLIGKPQAAIQGLNGILSIPHACNNNLCRNEQSFQVVYPQLRQFVQEETDIPLAQEPSMLKKIERQKK